MFYISIPDSVGIMWERHIGVARSSQQIWAVEANKKLSN